VSVSTTPGNAVNTLLRCTGGIKSVEKPGGVFIPQGLVHLGIASLFTFGYFLACSIEWNCMGEKEGHSYQEIGEITGLNESQVKVYIYRARVTLKDYIVKMENVA
jgi:hypothetical protein